MTLPPGSIRTQGRGAAIVLVHGTGGNRSSFGTLPWYLRDRFRVVTYDRRGTGAWPLPPDAEPPSVEQHALDLADVVRSLAGEPTVVLGTSFGAAIVLELLRTRPVVVAGALLHEPALLGRGSKDPGSASPVGREFLRLAAEGRQREAAESFLARMEHHGTTGDPAASVHPSPPRKRRVDWQPVYRDLAAAVAWDPCLDVFRHLEVPVLLLESEQSAPATRAGVATLAGLLPAARREVIAHARHVLAGNEVWRRVAEIVGAFADVCTKR